MPIIYKTSKDVPFDKLDALIDSVGWGVRGEEAWGKIVKASSLLITAWEQDHLVGMGRILEDGTMCMIYDIVVHPHYQRRKIGSALMRQIKDVVEKRPFQSIGLFAWDKNPASVPFYEKIGFKRTAFGLKLNT